MMKCPRCGFTQPRDQYCAQCGLDISNYKPPKKSLFDQITQNPLAQLIFVGLIIFFVASSIIKKKKDTVSERVKYLKGNLQISSEKPNTNSTADQRAQTPPPNDYNQTKPSAMAESRGFSNPKPTDANSPNATKSMTAQDTKGLSQNSENKVSHVVKINFYEISNRVRDMLVDESRGTGQFNAFSDYYYAGLLNQFHHKLKSFGNQAQLLHSEIKNVENDKSISWFNGLESSTTGNNIGFRYALEVSEIEPGLFKLNFEILKSWKEGVGTNTSIEKTSFPIQIDMQKSSAAFIGGILIPPATQQENDDYISSIPPFSILKSRLFRAGQTQFMTLIEIEK